MYDHPVGLKEVFGDCQSKLGDKSRNTYLHLLDLWSSDPAYS